MFFQLWPPDLLWFIDKEHFLFWGHRYVWPPRYFWKTHVNIRHCKTAPRRPLHRMQHFPQLSLEHHFPHPQHTYSAVPTKSATHYRFSFVVQFPGFDPELPAIPWRDRKTPSTSGSSNSRRNPLETLQLSQLLHPSTWSLSKGEQEEKMEKREGRARGAEWPVWARDAMGCRMEKGGSWNRTNRGRRRKRSWWQRTYEQLWLISQD